MQQPLELLQTIYTHFSEAIAASIILVVGILFARFTYKLFNSRLRFKHLDTTLRSFIANVIYVSLLILTVITALGKLGIPTASLVTAVGATGLAVGLALQASLANVASGIFIIALRLFKVGDVIESNGVTGTVERISLFNTQLRNGESDEEITIPNAKIANDKIIKKSRVK